MSEELVKKLLKWIDDDNLLEFFYFGGLTINEQRRVLFLMNEMNLKTSQYILKKAEGKQ